MTEIDAELRGFHVNIRRLISETPGMTDSKLSKMLGKSNRSYVGKMLENESMPGADVFLKLCTIFRVTPEELCRLEGDVIRTPDEVVAGMARMKNVDATIEAPCVDAVHHAWLEQGESGKFGSEISDYIEYFDAPDTDVAIPKPVELGSRSIASSMFDIGGADELLSVFEKFKTLDVAHAIAQDHFDVLKFGFKVDRNASMTINFENGKSVIIVYDRCLMRVKRKRNFQIANFCQLKRKMEVINRDTDDALNSDRAMSMTRSVAKV